MFDNSSLTGFHLGYRAAQNWGFLRQEPDRRWSRTNLMQRLPFALSIPHGGVETPEELVGTVIVTPEDQREDIDHLTREIFSVPEGLVAAQITFETARTFVDLNRHPNAWGAEQADGVVKSLTHLNRPVFSQFPDRAIIERLLDRLYRPYHQRLAELVEDPEVVLLLDCHSMAPASLPVSPDRPGQPRPMINLGHRGGASAPFWLVQTLQEVMAEVYQLPLEEVRIDYPFNGGYITHTYHSPHSHAIQIEFNRAFYLGDQEGQARPVLDFATLEQWREKFARCLRLLHQRAYQERPLALQNC
jgi:N-formylglutamate amidohydrolase